MLRPCCIFDLITGKYVYRIKSQVCKLNLYIYLNLNLYYNLNLKLFKFIYLYIYLYTFELNHILDVK